MELDNYFERFKRIKSDPQRSLFILGATVKFINHDFYKDKTKNSQFDYEQIKNGHNGLIRKNDFKTIYANVKFHLLGKYNKKAYETFQQITNPFDLLETENIDIDEMNFLYSSGKSLANDFYEFLQKEKETVEE